MEIQDVINRVEVYGFKSAVRGSKYPMATDLSKVTEEVVPRTFALAKAIAGSGHDNFLNGIIVQFDLTFSNKAWVEAERYHFLDFISSQSTMHRITKFDLGKSYMSYVDPRMIEIMKEKVKAYNDLQEFQKNKVDVREEERNDLKQKYLEILYSNPCGFRLTARMTTNYRQLKTIYKQRKDHRLPEWRVFCKWVETLPYAQFITGESKQIVDN